MNPAWPTPIAEAVRSLHADGLVDTAIRDRMPDVFAPGRRGRQQIVDLRRKLGLPSNPMDPAARRESYNRARHEWLASRGVTSPYELGQKARRDFATNYGLPADLRPAQVRIILALLDGPKALPDLKIAIGAKPSSELQYQAARTTFHGDLIRRGMVACLPDRRYMLTLSCLEMIAEGAQQ